MTMIQAHKMTQYEKHTHITNQMTQICLRARFGKKPSGMRPLGAQPCRPSRKQEPVQTLPNAPRWLPRDARAQSNHASEGGGLLRPGTVTDSTAF